MFHFGDFDINLMHYNEHKPKNEVLDSLASNSYTQIIIQSDLHNHHFRTLIDNIFSNVISKDIIFGTVTATMSDHLSQLLISPKLFLIHPPITIMFSKGIGQIINQENLILDYFDKDQPNLLNMMKKILT